MSVHVCYIWPNYIKLCQIQVHVILFNDDANDVSPFRFSLAPHRKTDWNWWVFYGFFMVMDGISRIGIGLRGLCKARLVSWEKPWRKPYEKPMKNPWFPVKKNPFNPVVPGISSNWWLVYLPPEEMMFVRLDHPNWGRDAITRCKLLRAWAKAPRWALVHTLALC